MKGLCFSASKQFRAVILLTTCSATLRRLRWRRRQPASSGHPPGIPAGTYTVVVTATSGSTKSNTGFTLIVQ
jgi:hypothetical protein